jgi:hypothetical protein
LLPIYGLLSLSVAYLLPAVMVVFAAAYSRDSDAQKQRKEIFPPRMKGLNLFFITVSKKIYQPQGLVGYNAVKIISFFITGGTE